VAVRARAEDGEPALHEEDGKGSPGTAADGEGLEEAMATTGFQGDGRSLVNGGDFPVVLQRS
jgi:hypothetical protein